MSTLGQVCRAVEGYNVFVSQQVERARTDEKARQEILKKWIEARSSIKSVTTPIFRRQHRMDHGGCSPVCGRINRPCSLVNLDYGGSGLYCDKHY